MFWRSHAVKSASMASVPAAVDLACRVDTRAEPLLTERVAQSRQLGRLHYPLRELRRDEDDASVAAQHDVSRHDEGAANTDRHVDTDHGGIEARAGAGVADVMRRVVGADERPEVLQPPQPVDVPHGAVVDDAVAGA